MGDSPRSMLEAIVKHDARLDILCCLIDGESMTVQQLSARTAMPMSAVGHHIGLLALLDLVEEGDLGGEPAYAAKLDKHPDWVRATVEEHRSEPEEA